jgi:hypothetical protein
MSTKPIRPLCQRLLENMREHQFAPEMHNASISMEGLTNLDFLSLRLPSRCRRLSDFEIINRF